MESPKFETKTASKQEGTKEEFTISEKTLSIITERSGLTSPLSVLARTPKGNLNENLIVANDEDRYFLKGLRSVNVKRATQTHAVEDFMHSEGMPAVVAIGTSGEKDILEQDHLWSLYPYVDGKHYESSTITPQALTSAGQALAQIHQVTMGKEQPFDMPITGRSSDPSHFTKDMDEIIAHINSKETFDDFDRAILESFQLKSSLKNNRSELTDLGSFPHCITHGDYQATNFLFDENDNLVWIVDWEQSTWRARISEVVRSIVLMCFDSEFNAEGFEKASHFISAYYEKQPFSKEELRAGFTRFFENLLESTWIPMLHYNGNKRVAQFLPRETNNIRYLNEHLDQTVEKLYSSIR